MGSEAVLSVVLIGLVGPMEEELILRGLVFPRLRKISSTFAATILTSLIFAVAHYPEIPSMFHAFVIGAFAAFLYRRYNSLIAPIALHMAVNMSSFIPAIIPFAGGWLRLENLYSFACNIALSSILLVLLLSWVFSKAGGLSEA